jgi:CSLREA domain-containing protein
VVNAMADAVDSSAGDGVCRTAGNQCTLRAAIMEANALLGHDVIEIPVGVYEIEIPVMNEDFPSTGDHDIVDTVTIAGAGAGATVLDGGFPLPGANIQARGLDRVFEIHPSAGNVTISTAATAPSRSSAGYMEWTVTSQVQSMYSGSNHGFLIRDATESGGGNEQGFHSREKVPDNPPQLVVTFG